MVEKLYGPEVFYEDAANFAIPDAYEEAAKDSGLEIVSRPEIDVVDIGKGKEFVFSATVALKPEVTLGGEESRKNYGGGCQRRTGKGSRAEQPYGNSRQSRN